MKKPPESVENYLEAILVLQKRNGSVRSIDIAREMGFSKPSISVAMKNLRASDYIVMQDGQITLTESGYVIARRVYDRHMLLTEWLIALGVDEQTADEDACKMEHGLSEESFVAIQRHIEITKKTLE
ncbi:MAG: metal-dependent transcriptional regulator [Oscillospiraceae bacterium]|nr:metal-dependent transcriptional regulator [Oscillospiraceae bacterium]